jgi:hypothetical protein
MIKNTDSLNLNAPIADPNRANRIANTEEITNLSNSIGHRCSKCKSLSNINARNVAGFPDPNGKRHFCSDVDRILFEEECVIEIQKILNHYNKQLSSFQLELKMDDYHIQTSGAKIA